MAFVGRKPTNAPLTADDIPNGIIGAADLASGISGLITWQSVQTTGFTAVAGRGYPCNTTSAAFTVTLPASPSVGDTIILLDYAGTFATNNITLGANSNKINGATGNKMLTTSREAISLTYIDSTQGWLSSSGVNEGTQSIDPLQYSVDFLVIAGGGSGGSDNGGAGGAGGYRSSNATYGSSGGGANAESSLTFTAGTVYTITVGAGGAGVTSTTGNNGVDSSISGTGISTITSIGGGRGAGGNAPYTGSAGGSGGGGHKDTGPSTGGSGTANQGFAGGNGQLAGNTISGGGGGAGEAGNTDANGEGGDGVASTITGSSVTRAGGGGGVQSKAGGTGGGGTGATSTANVLGGDATVNTGGGGGGGGEAGARGGNGGSGVVILSMPDANYSGTTTGSPTVATGVSGKTVLTFTGSGTYTG